jgi:hypothetical protein
MNTDDACCMKRYAKMQDGEIVEVYNYQYTGSQQQQVGGEDFIPTWTTAHDNPRRSDYINLGYEPLY